MSEIRKDPVVERWVIITNDPVRSPVMSPAREQAAAARHCPFCPGNEHLCPPEIMAVRPGGDGQWSVRVVPNRSPVLVVEEELKRMGAGMYDKITGVGANEVIIESRTHNIRQSQMEPGDLENVLWTYRDRILDLKRDERIRYVMVHRNHGSGAGARIEHPYSLLTALPLIPTSVMDEIEGARKHFTYKERCVYCDIIRQEEHDAARLVVETRHFIAVQAFAPRLPFETWIIPKRHASRFIEIEPGEVQDFARILKDVLGRIDCALMSPAYNYCIHTAPLDDECEQYYHWHLEILPRTGTLTGFELGSGLYLNSTPPEDAAAFLRSSEVVAAL